MQNPSNRVFLDTVNLFTIVKDGELGDPERLSKFVRRGEVAEQVLRAAYEGGKWPSGFQGQVYLPVDCH